MTIAIAAIGTLLKIGDGSSPETFTTIPGITQFSPPNQKSDVLDVTALDSPDNTREKILGLIDSGDVTFTLNFDPAQATHGPSTGLMHDFNERTLRNFKAILSDAGNSEWTFSAYVTSFAVKADPAGVLTADVTLTVSGASTLTVS